MRELIMRRGLITRTITLSYKGTDLLPALRQYFDVDMPSSTRQEERLSGRARWNRVAGALPALDELVQQCRSRSRTR